MTDNYYLILGVSPGATARDIKQAYRSLSLRYHPDKTGEAGIEPFLHIQEAYDALHDPARRLAHNRQLGRRRPPIRDYVLGSARPVDLFAEFERFFPSFEEVTETFIRSFTGRHAPKSGTAPPIDIEIVLSPDEAAAGGHLPIRIPAYRACARCDGTGQTGYFTCDDCAGRGLQEEPALVDVLIPREVADNTVIPVSLRHLGAGNLCLNVHVRVAQPSTRAGS